MKLQLKAIKHSDDMSEETFCYSANLYCDGKMVAHVGNSGKGGADMVHPSNGHTQAKIQEIENYIKTLEEVDVPGFDETIPMNLEIWCGDQIMIHLARKDLKAWFKTKVVGLQDGEIMLWKNKNKSRPMEETAELVKKQNPGIIVLNTLPFDVAVSIFLKIQGGV